MGRAWEDEFEAFADGGYRQPFPMAPAALPPWQPAARPRRRILTAVLASAGAVALIAGVVGCGPLRGQGGAATTARVGASPSAGVPTPPAPSAGAPVPSADPGRLLSCEPTTLPLPLGVSSVVVYGADPTGRYVAGASVERDALGGGRTVQAIVWDDGGPHIIAVTGAGASAHAVNSHGVVAGDGVRPDAFQTGFAWVYRDGRVTDLDPPAGYAAAWVTAINDRGDVVGYASRSNSVSRDTDEDEDKVPVFWPAGRAARVLAAPGPASVSGIADDGTMVGELTVDKGAYLWDAQGHGRLLPDAAGMAGGSAAAINGDWVTGWGEPASPGNGGGGAVRWNLRTGTATAYPGTYGFGQVNAHGVAVVTGPGKAADGMGIHPALANGSQVIPLPRPANSGGGRDLQGVFAVAVSDDDATVVGDTYDDTTGKGVPLVWRC